MRKLQFYTKKIMYKEILDKIIKPEYRNSLNDWISYAKENDRKGLEIIEMIYKSKGIKPVVFKLAEEKVMYETQMSFLSNSNKLWSLQQAEQKFRRKQITTSYNFYHGGLSAPKNRSDVNIFQFKTLQKMDLSRPFSAMAIQFIDNWLQTKDDIRYQKLVLSCLRSLNSKVHLSDPGSTEMKTRYNWKNDWDLAKPVRIDKAGQDLFAYKPNLFAIQKQQQKEAKHKQKLKQLQTGDFAKNPHLYNDFKIK